jgi:hypothetical protein
LEEIVHSLPELESLKDTGLERSQALREDIAWILDFDRSGCQISWDYFHTKSINSIKSIGSNASAESLHTRNVNDS